MTLFPSRPLSFALATLLMASIWTSAVYAKTLTLPLNVNYGLIQKALDEQLLTAGNDSVEVFADDTRCNHMTLSDMQVAGTPEGQVRIVSTINTQVGTPIGEQCYLAVQWQGKLETIEQAVVNADGSAVDFRIVDIAIQDIDGQPATMPNLLLGWTKRYVQPRLEAVTLDFKPTLAAIGKMLDSALPGSSAELNNLAQSLKLDAITTNAETINIQLSIDIPELPGGQAIPTLAADGTFSEQELAQWDANWQVWDGFATWLIKTLAQEPALGVTPELSATLGDILLEARYDLRAALAAENRDQDPVRELFLNTWSRLAPLLTRAQSDAPAAQVLQYASFITAVDALKTLDATGAELGLRFDANTFRSLARLLMPSVTPSDLSYDTAVDPQLRRLLGLEATFEPDQEEGTAQARPFAWLIPSAQAASLDPALVKKLTHWVPVPGDLDLYIQTMDQLLNSIISSEREKGKIPTAYIRIYEDLIRATAWQETCWRQFVKKAGKVEPIQSSAGSVGLMQVNQHVWRGVYDLNALHNNVGYNARAGNEILVHYLVDYAIRKKEHEITGNPDNLARASYAVYNGGPRHLSRYRNPNTSASLKKIDAAFWKKYLAIQKDGATAIKQCFAS